jgi:hypothetical protein
VFDVLEVESGSLEGGYFGGLTLLAVVGTLLFDWSVSRLDDNAYLHSIEGI